MQPSDDIRIDIKSHDYSLGYRDGLAVGIACTIAFFAVVAVACLVLMAVRS
jgi:hypothetical protein